MNLFKNVLKYNYDINNAFKILTVIHFVGSYKIYTSTRQYFDLKINKFVYDDDTGDNISSRFDLYAADRHGQKLWYKNRKLHREGNRPAKISRDNMKFWYKYNVLKRFH